MSNETKQNSETAWAFASLGETHRLRGKDYYDMALTNFNRAIELNPRYGWAIAHRGETYRQKGLFPMALTDFNRAIELNGSDIWALAHRGETYSNWGRYRDAVKDFDSAIKLNPKYSWALAHRGAAYRFLGENHYEQALADLQRSIEVVPTYAWAWAYKFVVYTLMGRYEEALNALIVAITLDNTIITNPSNELGQVFAMRSKYPEAIACYSQALKENPDDFISEYNLAVGKAKWQGLKEAEAEVSKARTLVTGVTDTGNNRNNATDTEKYKAAIYRLGGLAALEGNRDRALQYLREAISLDQNSSTNKNDSRERARHDIAWLSLREDEEFKALIADIIED
jgi:tetratricopeptide (TPR) repeat protein